MYGRARVLSWLTKLGSSMLCRSMLVVHNMWGSGFFSTARRECCISSSSCGVLMYRSRMCRIAEEAAGPTRGVQEDLARLRVDAVRNERRHGPRRVVLPRVPSTLQVVEHLLIHVPEVLPLSQVVEIDLVDLVDHLAEQVSRLHVVVGVLEHTPHNAPTVPVRSDERQFLQARKQLLVDEIEQCV